MSSINTIDPAWTSPTSLIPYSSLPLPSYPPATTTITHLDGTIEERFNNLIIYYNNEAQLLETRLDALVGLDSQIGDGELSRSIVNNTRRSLIQMEENSDAISVQDEEVLALLIGHVKVKDSKLQEDEKYAASISNSCTFIILAAIVLFGAATGGGGSTLGSTIVILVTTIIREAIIQYRADTFRTFQKQKKFRKAGIWMMRTEPVLAVLYTLATLAL